MIALTLMKIMWNWRGGILRGGRRGTRCRLAASLMTRVRDYNANASVAVIRSAARVAQEAQGRPELLTPQESRHSLVVEPRIVAMQPMACLRYHHVGFTLEAAFEFLRDEEEHRRASLSRHQ